MLISTHNKQSLPKGINKFLRSNDPNPWNDRDSNGNQMLCMLTLQSWKFPSVCFSLIENNKAVR